MSDQENQKCLPEIEEKSVANNLRTRYSKRVAAALVLSPVRDTTRPPLTPIKESHQREKKRYRRIVQVESDEDEDKENHVMIGLPQDKIEHENDEEIFMSESEDDDDDSYDNGHLAAQGRPQVSAQGSPPNIVHGNPQVTVQESPQGYPNGDVLVSQHLPTPPGPGSPDSGVERERGVSGPEARYLITFSQILEIECLAKARSFDDVDVKVVLREIGQQRGLTLTHQLFDRLWDVSQSVNHTLNLIRSGYNIRSTIHLGENVCVTIKSNYPVTPIDIRRFDVVAGVTTASLEGQVLTPHEWKVLFNLLPTIHSRLTNVELDVRYILRQLYAELVARQGQ